jgi:hypothetical protein
MFESIISLRDVFPLINCIILLGDKFHEPSREDVLQPHRTNIRLRYLVT